MSLSSGTLNLKFMQRAKARAQAPSTPGTPGTPASTSAPSTPAPSAPTPAQVAEAAAEAEKWTLPSRFKRPNAAAGPSRPKVSFVGSYLPFVEEAEASGGRRTFGAPAAKAEEEDEDDEADGEDLEDAGVHGNLDYEGMDEDETKDRTFRRPAGFGTKDKGKKAKEDMVRGMKRVSLKRESSPGSGSEGEPVPKKRIKTEPEPAATPKAAKKGKKEKGTPSSSKHPTPSASKQPTPATSKESTPVPGKKQKAAKAEPGDIPPPPKVKSKAKSEAANALDERERAMKAAKKAAKKKAKA